MAVSKWWLRGGEVQDILIYTENLAVMKDKSVKEEPSGFYYHPRNKMKLTGVHYVCLPDSELHKALTKALGLTENERVKEVRKRRTKAEMEQARLEEANKPKRGRK